MFSPPTSLSYAGSFLHTKRTIKYSPIPIESNDYEMFKLHQEVSIGRSITVKWFCHQQILLYYMSGFQFNFGIEFPRSKGCTWAYSALVCECVLFYHGSVFKRTYNKLVMEYLISTTIQWQKKRISLKRCNVIRI